MNLKKILYISDLDGTLLNSSQQISKYTADTINKISQNGIIFSYATARSSGTAKKVTTNISANIPVIVYNGCFIIEQTSKKILFANYFTQDDYCKIYEDLQKHNVNPIVYSYINGVEKFSYIKSKINSQTQEFLDTRKGDIRENQVENLTISVVNNPFYFTCIADEKTLVPLFEKYKNEFSCVFHKDIYLNSYWLEIMPKGVNKANAIAKLKEILGCDYVVAFGDAKNDILMFEYADECYAVNNADNELKKLATNIIESNDDDGVAKWINKHINIHNIRKYQPNDIDEIAELFYNTVHSVNAKDYSQAELDAWATGEIDKLAWNKSFLEHNTIVTTFNGMITGFGDMANNGYLDRLYVHKDFQNQGIATLIVNELEKSAHELGITKFTSYASITAKPFFEKMGYTVIHENIVTRNNVKLINYKMEKNYINIYKHSVHKKDLK